MEKCWHTYFLLFRCDYDKFFTLVFQSIIRGLHCLALLKRKTEEIVSDISMSYIWTCFMRH